jgi:predicted Zn-dependent peptidase
LYRKTVLDNGVRVVTENIPHVHSVSTGIWVNGGSRDERPAERGLTHLLEHMLFKGTERRNAMDIAKELDSVGGFANGFTTKENLCLHAKVLERHLDLVVDILQDIFLHSVLSQEEIERERQVILQEIRMIEDTPDEYVHVLFQQFFWENNPLGAAVYGDAETVQNFRRQMLLQYLDRLFQPARILVAAAGNVDHERFVDLVAPAMEGIAHHAEPIIRETPSNICRRRVIAKDLEQVHICQGFAGCSHTDPRRFASHALNVVLGSSMSSRLFQEVRERRGLAYSIFSFLNSHEDTGMMGVYAGVDPERVDETLDVVRTELESLADVPIPSDELEAAKEYLKGSMYLNAESTDSRMNRLARNEFLFGRLIPFEEIESEIDAVTPEQVRGWFHSAYREDGVATLLYGPAEVEAPAGSLEVL